MGGGNKEGYNHGQLVKEERWRHCWGCKNVAHNWERLPGLIVRKGTETVMQFYGERLVRMATRQKKPTNRVLVWLCVGKN